MLWKLWNRKTKIFTVLMLMIFINAAAAGCGSVQDEDKASVEDMGKAKETDAAARETIGIAAETAGNAQAETSDIDVTALKEENPDIFAWIHIPDTQIDYPVLQSEEADDFYESHNAYGKEDDAGAVYIELANLTSMCDFNTVLHGKTGTNENGLFADLYRFSDPYFFEEHEKVYLYLDGNVLTYEIFAAYERENTSLIRTYDFTYTAGCRQFLDDLYGVREMNKNLREGWDDLTPYHFLITLTTQKEDNAEKQFIVVAALIDDAAGTIDRVVTD